MKISTRLIEVDDLIKLVNLALLTGRVKNARPVSMLLLGDTETGKTQILEVFMNLKSIIWANDRPRSSWTVLLRSWRRGRRTF